MLCSPFLIISSQKVKKESNSLSHQYLSDWENLSFEVILANNRKISFEIFEW